jgi:multidrug efflux pump subunit AcrA (membrane-fusion protein)
VIRRALVFAGAALLLAGCGGRGQPQSERGVGAVPVEVVRIVPETVSATVTTTGTLRAVDDVPVAAETGGRVVEVPVSVGDRVEKGDVLVRLDDELAGLAVRQANSQWLLTKTELEDASDALSRAEVLWENEDISKVEFEAAQRRLEIARASYDGALAALGAAQRQLDNASVKAPVDATMKLDLGLSEDQITGVHEGDPVSIQVRALPGRTFQGTVEYVGRRSEDVNRTYPVRVRLLNPGRELRSGMVAEATVTAGRFPDAVVVERDWVVDRFGEPAVYVAADSLAEVRRITLGKALGDRVVVTSGLSEGDLLITVGLDLLSDQARIDIKSGPAEAPAAEDKGR